MFHFILIQIGFIWLVYILFGYTHAIYFIISAMIGFLFLETVNYLEHYGFKQKKVKENIYEKKIMPVHSWNSNHYIGQNLSI